MAGNHLPPILFLLVLSSAPEISPTASSRKSSSKKRERDEQDAERDRERQRQKREEQKRQEMEERTYREALRQWEEHERWARCRNLIVRNNLLGHSYIQVEIFATFVI